MCKKQRAVLEALRFCRLIGNPKISTFNMLLSVCASSLDFDGNFSNLEVLAFLVKCARVGTEAWNMTKYFLPLYRSAPSYGAPKGSWAKT